LKHSDSYERSGRVDPDEDLLEVGAYEENLMDDRVNEHDDNHEEADQVRDRQHYRTHHHLPLEEPDSRTAIEKQEDELEKLLCKNETLTGAEDDDDLYPDYFSKQGALRGVEYAKPRGLSFDDLAASPESDQKTIIASIAAVNKRKASQ
jgi:hypothetical protein